MKKEFIQVAKTVGAMLKKNSPVILTGTAMAGLLSTTVLAVRATPKALDRIADASIDEKGNVIELTKWEKLQVAAIEYVPTAISFVGTGACIIGAQTINGRRLAAMSALYSMSETALKDYKEEVLKTVGGKKSESIKDAINKKKVDDNPPNDKNVIVTGRGEVLCYETISGRYFKSTADVINKAENELVRQMNLGDSRISVNEWYYGLGLTGTKLGDEMGWTIESPLEVRFTSSLASDGTPVLCVDYVNDPFPWYRD